MEDLRYPIGRFDWQGEMTAATRARALQAIAALPRDLRAAVDGFDRGRLATPYRDGGWTVAQVVHHLADSHTIGFARVKCALTDDNPVVHAYDEDKFAALDDTALDPAVSLGILDGVHARWTAVARALSEEDLRRPLVVPRGPATVDRLLHLYGWHSSHHVSHITSLRRRLGW